MNINIKRMRLRYICYNIIIIAALGGLIYLYYLYNLKSSVTKLRKAKLTKFTVLELGLNAKLSNAITDLKIISQSLQIRSLLNAPHDAEAKRNVNDLFLLYERNSPFYDQIRYLNMDGKEICRAN